MSITVTTTGNVDVNADTTTTNTTNTNGATASSDDRRQLFNNGNAIVGTVAATRTVSGAGLELVQQSVAALGVSMANSGAVNASDPAVSGQAAMQLTGNGGAVAYSGAGTVTGTAGASGLALNNVLPGSGNVTATVDGDVSGGVGIVAAQFAAAGTGNVLVEVGNTTPSDITGTGTADYTGPGPSVDAGNGIFAKNYGDASAGGGGSTTVTLGASSTVSATAGTNLSVSGILAESLSGTASVTTGTSSAITVNGNGTGSNSGIYAASGASAAATNTVVVQTGANSIIAVNGGVDNSGIFALNESDVGVSTGNISITTGTGSIINVGNLVASTPGEGIGAYTNATTGTATAITVLANGGGAQINVTGDNIAGINAQQRAASGTGDVSVTTNSGHTIALSDTTSGGTSYGIHATNAGSGKITVTAAGTIIASGFLADIEAINATANTGDITVNVNAAIAVAGGGTGVQLSGSSANNTVDATASITGATGIRVNGGTTELKSTAGSTTITGTTAALDVDSGTLRIGSGTISLVGNITDDGILAVNRATAFSIGGDISGTGALQQTGNGTTTLTGTNTYGGGTTISAGTLQIGNGGATGSFAGDVLDNATLAINRSGTFTINGDISGTGAFLQNGTGITILSATSGNTYGGTTTINAGTLQVDGSIGNSATTVVGGTLAGNGSLGGTVTVQSGAHIAPGASAGDLAVGSFNLALGSFFDVEIGGTTAGTQYDQLIVTGTVTLAGALDTSLINSFNPATGNTFTIIDNDLADAVSGTFAGLAEGAIFTHTAGGTSSYKITYAGGSNSNDVVLIAINDAPVFTGASAGSTYVENQPTPVAIATAVDASDVDSANYNTGSVRALITAGGVTGDALTIADVGLITVSGNNISYNGTLIGTASGLGTNDVLVSLNSSADDVAVEALSTAFRFSTTSNDPGTTRTVTFTLNDGGGTANGGVATTSFTANVTVTPVNDEPTLTATPANLDFTEGAGNSQGLMVALFTGADVNTIEAGQGIVSLTFTVSGLHNGANETIRVDGTTFALTNGANGTTGGAAGMGYTVSVVGNALAGQTATVTLTKASPGVTEGALETLINGILYQNTNINAPTPGARVFTFTQIQDNGASGGGDDNTASLNVSSSVDVIAVNDAPVNTVPGAAVAAQEDTSIAIIGISVADVDASPQNVQMTLQVTNGILDVRTDVAGGVDAAHVASDTTGTVVLTGTTAQITATLGAANGLTYRGNLNFDGADTLSVTTNDLGHTGTPGAQSDGPDNVTINVANVTANTLSAFQSSVLKTDVDGDGQIDPGDTITTTVQITNNSATLTAQNITLAETLTGMSQVGDPNVSPRALNDSYNTIANTLLEVGNATSQTGPQATVSGSVVTNDVEFFGDTFVISAVGATAVVGATTTITTANGATVIMVTDNSADRGSFTYAPAPGFSGSDSFTYTIKDDGIDGIAGNADDLSGTGTVTISVATPKVWYVDNNAAGGGDGTSDNPFDSLSDVSGASGPDGVNDIIYIASSATAYTGGIVLLDGQQLIGGGEALVVNAITLKAAGTAPVIENAGGAGITLEQDNTIKGVTVGNTSTFDIANATGATVGTLNISNVDLNGTGGLFRADSGGTLNNVTFNSASTTSASGHGIHIAGGASGSFTVNGTGAISGVTGTDVLIGASSAAVSIASNIASSAGGAIEVTGHTGASGVAFSGDLNITGGTGISVHDNTGSATIAFTNADADAQVVNTGTGSAISLVNNTGLTINFTGGGLDVDTTSGTAFTATGGGTVNVGTGVLTNTVNTTTGQILNWSGVNVGNATGVTFATLGSSGTVANTAISLNNVDGSGTFSGGAVTVAATSGASSDAIRIDGGSAATFTFASATIGSSTNNIIGDDGIDLNGANGAVTFTTVSINGTTGAGIETTGNTNAINISGGTIGNTNDPGAFGVDINGGTGNVTVDATINKTTAGDVVEVSGRTNGTVDFNASITAGGGIDLTSNTGGTVRFDGGMTLSTGANAAFSSTASTGGTVVVTGTNTLTTTTGTALNVANTTIGADDLTFESISSNGATSGIILNTTGSSGGLTVTGTGTANSGGTIANATGDGIVLTSTSDVVLQRMLISGADNDGIHGTNVNNFTFRDSTVSGFGNASAGASEDGMDFTNLTGTVTIQRSTIGAQQGFTLSPNPPTPDNKGIVIRNDNVADVNMTVTGSTFTQIDNDGIDIEIQRGDGSLVVDGSTADGTNTFSQINGRSITFGSTADNAANGVLDLNVKNNTFNTVGIGVRWAAQGGTDINAAVRDNTMTAVSNDAIRSLSDPSDASFGPTTTVDAIIEGNNFGGGGIFVAARRGSTTNMLLGGGEAAGQTGNTNIGFGISLEANRAGILNIDVLNNTVNANVAEPGVVNAAMYVQAANSGGGGSTITAKISGNSFQADVNDDPIGDVVFDNLSSTIRIEGWNGSPANNPTTFIEGSNTFPADSVANVVTSGTVIGFAGDAVPTGGPSLGFLMAAPSGGVEGTSPADSTPPAAAMPPADNTPPADAAAPADSAPPQDNAGAPDADDLPPVTPPAGTTPPITPAAHPVIVDDGVLTQAELDYFVDAAIARWTAAGLTDEQVATLKAMHFSVADMGGFYLGSFAPGHVTLDSDAASRGWFLDGTPLDDSEFGTVFSATRMQTDPSGAPAGHYDLLTTVMHEMGHTLGLGDSYAEGDRDDLMFGYLYLGERRIAAAGEADGAVAGSITGEEFLASPINIGDLRPGETVTVQWNAQIDPTNPHPPGQFNQFIQNPTNQGTVTTTTGAIAGTTTNASTTTLDSLALGDVVWVDAASSFNGVFDSGEGVDGVTLRLYADSNASGGLDAGDALLATTTTAGGGVYSFTGLAPGDYIVAVESTNFNLGAALYDAVNATAYTSIAGNPDPDNNLNNDDNGGTVGGVAGVSIASLPITLAYNTEPTNGTNNDTNNTLDLGFAGVPANAAPVVTAGSTPVFNETGGGPAVTLETALDVDDPDTPDNPTTLDSATVTITDFFAGDVLAFTPGFGITGGFAGNVLSLSGTASIADYETVLRSVTYRSTSDNPTNFGTNTDRIINWQVNDGTQNSPVATTTVTVTPENDAPALNSVAPTALYVLGTAGVTLAPAAATIDADNQNLTSATVDIGSGLDSANDVLTVNLPNVAGLITGTNITFTYTQATGTLLLSGSDTLARYQNALDNVQFSSTSTSSTPRVIDWVVNDGAADSNHGTTTITLDAAPVLDLDAGAGGSGHTATFTEDNLSNGHFIGSGAVSVGNFPGGVTIADADAGDSIVSATIDLTNAKPGDLLTYIGTDPGISLDLSSTATHIVLTGTGDFAAAIEAVIFENTTENPDTTPRIINVVVNDGDTNSNTAVSTITVVSVNDEPVNVVPLVAQVVNEDTDLSITGISMSDPEANPATENVTVTLHVNSGTLDIRTDVASGITGGQVAGDTTGNVVVTATLNQINATLAAANGLLYHSSLNFSGSDQLTVTTNDNGHTGTDPDILDPVDANTTSERDVDTVNITVNAVNDAPVNSVPLVAQPVNEDTNLVFNAGNGNLISVSDVDAGSNDIRVTLAVANGTLTLGTIAGLVFSSGNGTQNATMTFDGTLAEVNAALDGLTYKGQLNFFGGDTLTLTTNDLGHNGADPGLTGGATSEEDTDTVTINVAAVNDAPVNTVPAAAQAVNEDTDLVFNLANSNLISVADVDANPDDVRVTLTVASGTLTLATTAGLIFFSGANGTSAMAFDGTVAEVNAALDGLTYHGNLNSFGSDTLSLTTNDLGHNGLDPGGDPASEQDADTIAINVASINDAPVFSPGPTPFGDTPTFIENGPAIVLDANANNAVTDVELAATGNYAGATLIVSRVSPGTPLFEDIFGGSGSLVFQEVDVEVGGIAIGSYTQQEGVLEIIFNASATGTLVNDVLRQLTYLNTNDAPPPSVDIGFTLIDNNSGAQGSGGPLSGFGHIVVTINPTNDPPLLTSVATAAAYEPGTAGSPLSPSLTVSDPDGPPAAPASSLIAGATVTIAAGFVAGDLLSVDPLALTATGITALYNPGTHVLTLSGTKTVADYQQVLDTVTYSSSNPDPGNGGANPTRTIQWQAIDTLGAASTVTPETTTLVHFAFSPKVDLDGSAAGNDFATSFTENGAPVSVADTDISVTDPDSTELAFAVVKLTNALASDSLSVSGALPGGIFASVDTSTPGEITVSLNGSATPAAYQTAIRQVVYSNSSDNPDTTPRDIIVFASDDELVGNTAHTTVNVIAVNDPPVLSGLASSASYRPHRPSVTLAAALSLSDFDNTTLASATVHISAGTFAGDGDVLAVSAGGLTGTAISASYNAITETLMLTGVDTLAHYEQVLEHVTFESTSVNPTNAGLNKTRTVEWQVNDGSGANNLSAVTTTTINIVNPPLFDFNGDGRGDILWQNTDGTPAVWLMNGTGVASMGPALPNPNVPPALFSFWKVIDAGDFNGDGKSDILWQNFLGTPAVWLMDGTGLAHMGPGLPNPGFAWHAKEAADFNGDGKSDILWQNDNGAPAVWLMDGANVLSTGPALANPGPAWHAKDAADFNGDGKADILWQNDNGAPAVWLMDGVNVLSAGPGLANPGPAWHEIAAADFNGDGKADILWQNDDGTPAVWLMDGVNVLSIGPALANPGTAWHAKEAADTNGDGMADIVWQHDNGTPAVWLMNGTAVSSFGPGLTDPGSSWHIV